MKGDRILIDTSVWIEYFKNQDKHFTGKVDQLLTFSNACVPKVVIAELLRGAKSEKEISVIEEFVEAFNILDQSDDTWIKAGRLSFSMKRRGVTVDIIFLSRWCKIFDSHKEYLMRKSLLPSLCHPSTGSG